MLAGVLRRTLRSSSMPKRPRSYSDNPSWGSRDACSLKDLNLSKDDAILYQDEQYVVLNKPPDLRMDGPHQATVEKLLQQWYSEQLRPVHQLDYATSGVLLVARSKAAANHARIEFEERRVKKSYLAVVHGRVEPSADLPTWTEDEVDRKLVQLEEHHRKKQRKNVVGSLPGHAFFQKFQQGASRAPSNVPKEEWEKLWKSLEGQVEDEWRTRSWAEIKQQKWTGPFEQASQAYNQLLLDQFVEPTFTPHFRTDESIYISVPLAPTPDDFAMRIPPSHANDRVPVGDESLDYRPCLTRCHVLETGASTTHVELEPRTGRRHQLRVHMAWAGHAIVGDATYSRSDPERVATRMCLHAHKLELTLYGQHHVFVAPKPF